MSVVGVLLVAQVLVEEGIGIAVRHLGGIVGHPAQVVADVVVVLGAADGGLLRGQLAPRPLLEERLVAAVLRILDRDQFIAKAHDLVLSG